jgi:hypothetical protein
MDAGQNDRRKPDSLTPDTFAGQDARSLSPFEGVPPPWPD